MQVALHRMAGLFLGAGREIVETESFVKALEKLQGTRLSVDWQNDGGEDDMIYSPSAELLRWLRPFPDKLSTIWANRPGWVLQDS